MTADTLSPAAVSGTPGAAIIDSGMVSASKPLAGKRVLIVVENLPLPFDRRVWQEARTLVGHGAHVSVICPVGKGYEKHYEEIEGVHIYRHSLPLDAKGPLGYLLEYGAALFWESWLALKIYFKGGLDVIQGCNPPDLIFMVAWLLRPFGVKYIFDHHDINPELFEAKFNKRGPLWKLMCLMEKLTFKSATVSIATNESYRKIAIERGGMNPDRVFVVRSGPDLSKLNPVAPVEAWKNGRTYMVGYVGVMGDQEGIDLLIEAVAHLVFVKKRQDVQFCLVGGGPALADLKAMTTRLGLDDYITFTGRAPNKEFMEILSTMDLGVNPDRVNPMNDKSTMNKIMEYMAMGKPMVQFDVTEGRFSAQEASLYAKANDPVDMAEKILALLADPERCAAMGAFGRARVERELSWNHQVQPLIASYKMALNLA